MRYPGILPIIKNCGHRGCILPKYGLIAVDIVHSGLELRVYHPTSRSLGFVTLIPNFLWSTLSLFDIHLIWLLLYLFVIKFEISGAYTSLHRNDCECETHTSKLVKQSRSWASIDSGLYDGTLKSGKGPFSIWDNLKTAQIANFPIGVPFALPCPQFSQINEINSQSSRKHFTKVSFNYN